MKPGMFSIILAAALGVGTAQAAGPDQEPTARQKATHAEIDRLVQGLSRELGENSDVRVIVRRGGLAPGARGQRERWGERLHAGLAGVRSSAGLGIVMALNPAAGGVRIAAVTPDGPAMKAGLRSGDVLLSIDGKSIGGKGVGAVASARELLGDLKQGQSVKLRYARLGKTYDASVKADAILRVMVINGDEFGPMAGRSPIRDGLVERHKRLIMLLPDVEMDIERLGPMHGCAPGSEDCELPALFQAFRWQGLNLASVDASLGRYFGTDKGVLVVSSGSELKGLQSGDVIQRVAGKEVRSPRDVMRALREKESGSQLRLDVLRDRKSTAVTITVPKSRPLAFLAPPPPPPAPAPPAPPAAAPPPPPPSR